jgi:hypothetical protein
MIVHDFDFGRTFCGPNEAHPEFVVDPDRVLPSAISHQRLQSIARRRPQVAEIIRRIEIAEFPASRPNQIGREALRSFSVEDGLGRPVPERSDHELLCIIK